MQPHLSGIERYLEAQVDATRAEDALERDQVEARLAKAKWNLEKQAAAGKTGIRRILVAADHHHHPALEAAINIAKPLRAQVAIVYVLEPLPAPNLEIAYDMTPAWEEWRAAAKEMVTGFEREISPDALAFAVLREGNAATEIVSAAKDFDADLIVMGIHRRGALARFFMGSVSQAVLKAAHCPVMLVTDNAQVPEEQPAATVG
jgi:nucleotide-binding universal stress UspA family protein